MKLWIESHVAMSDHPKTRKLARRLGIPIAHAIGLLHCLWHWSIQYAEDGSLARHDPEDIAVGAKWEGDSKTLLDALVGCGWIDAGTELRLHDWHDYAGKLLALRKARSEGGKKGAQTRWGTTSADSSPYGQPNESPNGSVNGSAMASDTTNQTNRPDKTYPPSKDTADFMIAAKLRADGYSDDVVNQTMRELVAELEKNPGGIRYPLAWGRSKAKKLQGKKRTAALARSQWLECSEGHGAFQSVDGCPTCATEATTKVGAG